MTNLVPEDPARRFSAVERRLTQLEFGVPFPAFRAELSHAITVPTDTITDVDWDDWEICDERFFVEDNIVSGRLRTLDLVVPGRYTFNIEIGWATDFDFNHTIILNDGYGYPTRVTHGQTSDSLGGQFLFCRTKSFWPYDPSNAEVDPDSPPTAPMSECGVQVNQDSGVSKDIDSGSFEIYYDGGISCQVPTPMP